MPFGRPPGEQEQVAVVGVDDLAQVGEDLAERVADGPVDGPGIDAQGHIHEAEAGKDPVLLVPPQLRPLLARYARLFAPGLHVLSYNEVPDELELKIMGALM